MIFFVFINNFLRYLIKLFLLKKLEGKGFKNWSEKEIQF
jgi:hypothetical protein